MGFRKFGTGDDQRVSLDREEDDALRKRGSAGPEWTEEDAEALRRENEK